MATGTAATFNAAIGSSNIGNSLKLDWLKCKGGGRAYLAFGHFSLVRNDIAPALRRRAEDGRGEERLKAKG
jgi:hypothetical protein